jgi:catechol 2,3-dioxygenase-like lactoylglutathione lyase family enzyme
MNSGFSSSGTRVSLTAKDLGQSVAWYRDVLGCNVLYQSENSAGINAGNMFIYLNLDDGKRGWDRVKGEGFALQFVVDGSVDDVADRIKAAGGKLESEPGDMPWGQRMFRLVDPDGYRLSIAADLPK